MKRFTSLLLLLSLSFSAAAADHLDQVLATLYQSETDLHYLGYDSVEYPQADAYGVQKYMVLDFFSRQKITESEAQAKVHSICMSLIRNQPLIRNLAAAGYDMVSVSFDAKSQYDCL